jgi:hypothetical protein
VQQAKFSARGKEAEDSGFPAAAALICEARKTAAAGIGK